MKLDLTECMHGKCVLTEYMRVDRHWMSPKRDGKTELMGVEAANVWYGNMLVVQAREEEVIDELMPLRV